MELNWKWKYADIDEVPKNGIKVFSCFSCAGGSSMGYKIAGCTVLGNCEIDEKTNELYVLNHHPKFNFNMDIRDFAALDDYPEELKNLDILDGSPPCTTFSLAGDREESWGKLKKFAEGGKEQRLDDLFFPFIEIAKKLQPKVVVAENVKGLVLKAARGYVNEIIKAFDNAGYDVQIFLLNSAVMGVPQKRERVFFIARRKDLNLPKIKLVFNEEPILFGKVRSKDGRKVSAETEMLLSRRLPSDRCLADIKQRVQNKNSGFTQPIINDNDVCSTICAGGGMYRGFDGLSFSYEDFVHCQTFPEDFNFLGKNPSFWCGMSVPPIMMARIAAEIVKQWF